MSQDLGTLIRKHPRLLRLLHEQGVHFCAGCYLTLSATPERAAAYHGVPDVKEFIRRVERIVADKPPLRKHRAGYRTQYRTISAAPHSRHSRRRR